MAIQESGEMYLETILCLSKTKPSVRAIDVAEHMGYSKPSVSRAIALLKSGGYVTVNSDGHLFLTAEGEGIAVKIYERHTLLTNFLISLGVDANTAGEDACKIEHAISDTSFEALKQFIAKNQK